MEEQKRILLKGTRSVLQQSKLSRCLWSYAGKAVAYSGCVSPRKYVRNSFDPLKILRVFDVVGFAHISRDIKSNLDARAVKARFIEYSEDNVGYIVQRLDTKRMFYSKSLYYNEYFFVTLPISDALQKKFIVLLKELFNVWLQQVLCVRSTRTGLKTSGN